MMRPVSMAVLGMVMALSSCTVFNPERRTLTDWNLDMVEEHAVSVCRAPEGCSEWNSLSSTVIDWVTVEPLAIAMLPVSILGDTLILNPIDAWKCAEMTTHHNRHERHAEHSNEQAAQYAYQPLPPIGPPGPVASLLTVPEFLGRWLWGSTSSCAEPCSGDSWNEYWNEHKEDQGYNN